MKVINCSKETHCINFMQFQRYKKLYEDLLAEYNKLLSTASYDDEIEQHLAGMEGWQDGLC